ncbi:amidohydrolase family protein [Dyella telluris]|uniref:Amidohydrolase family protein n=1 Tax=Dyella telluris TaxID=2763498 RepID=A0A7G8Q389_9GAMM|nr:amidohydrolase family protein [Dyella telluris]QNK01247.1 amidohydrolase family protein [Dyella telluris]
MIIDAHRHYWDPTKLDYGWLAQAPAALQRPFLPADMDVTTDACLLVQAAPDERETLFLFDIARQTPGVLGVIGWVDMEASDATQRIAALAAQGQGLLRGIRPMVQDIPDTEWLARPSLDRAFDCLRDHGLVFDALVDNRHLRALSQRLTQHAGLVTVVDHAAKPDIAQREFAAWASAIARVAQVPDVLCKLSGLLTLTGEPADPTAVEPYAAHLFQSFGGERLMWGSDWPVLTTHASYDAWKRCAQTLTRRFAPQHEAAVFGETAAAVYSLAGDAPATALGGS